MPEGKSVKWVWSPLRKLMSRLPERNILVMLSLVVGICCGLAAVGLKLAIGGLHHLFSGITSGGGWLRYLVIVLPGVGMLLSLLIVRYLVRDDIGHGVTKVLVAVSKNDSRIKKHNMWSSLLTSALTIGFGGSVGAEAPIVYTGAAFGSNLARYMGLSYRNMTVLLGCGAAGAVAGIFNAPLAGVLFTLEILLFNISMSSILPLLVSTVSATVVSYLCLGQTTQFTCTLAPFAMRNIPFYLVLGVFCGFCSLYFMRMTLFLEDLLGRLGNPWIKWAICSALLGGMVFLLPPLYGEGYSSLAPLLHGEEAGLRAIGFFALVLLLKVFSMTFTNAGGGVGGTFGPTLFVGAIAGYLLSSGTNLILPGTVPTANFVLVGMAGLMAGVMQAPMTAIFLIAEISGGYQLFVPLIITSGISYGVMRIFEKYSIYTKRIAQTGQLLTHDSDQAVLTLLKTADLVETDFTPVRIDATLGELVEAVAGSDRNIFPVLDGKKRFQGFITLSDIRRDMFRTDLYDKAHVFNYMLSAPDYVHPEDGMDTVMRKFERTGAWNLPVVTADRTYVGFVSKSRIFNAYRTELRNVSQE
jgi:CIC family chloride channel protein